MNRFRTSFFVLWFAAALAGCAGCDSVDISGAARSSLSSFVTGVVTQAINNVIIEP